VLAVAPPPIRPVVSTPRNRGSLRPIAATRSVSFRPRAFPAPRRFSPHTGARACCSPLPAGVRHDSTGARPTGKPARSAPASRSAPPWRRTHQRLSKPERVALIRPVYFEIPRLSPDRFRFAAQAGRPEPWRSPSLAPEGLGLHRATLFARSRRIVAPERASHSPGLPWVRWPAASRLRAEFPKNPVCRQFCYRLGSRGATVGNLDASLDTDGGHGLRLPRLRAEIPKELRLQTALSHASAPVAPCSASWVVASLDTDGVSARGIPGCSQRTRGNSTRE
jgi:hypothetical protein